MPQIDFIEEGIPNELDFQPTEETTSEGDQGYQLPLKPIPLNEYQRRILENPGGPPMGAFGPMAPEELLAIPQVLKIPQTIAEPVMTAASDMASDFLRRTGIDPSATPGQPLFNVESLPVELRRGALWNFIPEPEFIQGARQKAEQLASGFTEPGAAALLPLAGAKPVQAMFGAGAMANIPEAIAAIPQAKTSDEIGGALAQAAADIGMTGLIAHSLTTPRFPGPIDLGRAATERRTYAPQKRFQQEGGQPEYQGAPEVGIPGEAGSGNRPLSTARLEKETQVLLSPEEQTLIDTGKQNISDPIRFTEESGMGGNQVATIDMDGNIVISLPAFRAELQKLSPERRQAVVNSTLAEESNHLRVMERFSDSQIEGFWNDLTPVEQALYRRLYSGKWTAEGIKVEYGEPLSDLKLGYEALNYFQMRISKMEPREIAAASKAGRIGLKSLEMLARGIYEARKALGREAASNQAKMLDDLLAKVNVGIVAAGGKEVGKEEGDMPFALQRFSKEELDKKLKLAGASIDEFAAATLPAEGGLTENAWKTGLSITEPSQLAAIDAARKQASARMQELMKSGKPGDAMSMAFQAQYWREAYEAATGTGSAGYALKNDPGYKPPFPEGRETPSALGRTERTDRELDAFSIAKNWLDWAEQAIGEGKSPLPLSRYTDRQLRDALSEDRMASYGPRTIKALHSDAIASAKQYVSAFPEKYPNIIKQFGVKREAPGALSRKRKDTGTIEFNFGEIKPGEEIQRSIEFGPTPFELESQSRRFIEEAWPTERNPQGKVPSFSEFAKHVRDNIWNSIKPQQMVGLYQNLIWDRLIRTSGQDLARLRKSLDLEKRFGTREIPDPRPSRAQFKLEEQGTKEGKASLKEERRYQTVQQNYRSKIIAAIGKRLVEPSSKYLPSITRKDINIEDVDFSKPKDLEPMTEFSSKERGDIPFLTKFLVEGARQFGDIVSNTKRVTVLVDKATGEAFMLGTYRDGRRGVVFKDPKSGGNVTLKDAMDQYVPVASILLEHPVKDFVKKFKSLGEWENALGTDLRRASRSALFEAPSAEGELTASSTGTGRMATPGTFQDKPGTIQRVTSGNAPALTRPEAGALMDHLIDVVDKVDTSTDVLDAIEDLNISATTGRLSPRDYTVISAYAKIFDGLRNKYEKATDQAIFDLMVKEIYDKARNSENATAFETSLLEEYGEKLPSTPSRLPGGQATTAETGARELTMLNRIPPTVTRGQRLPSAPGPEARMPEPVPPERLGPEESRYVRSQEYIQGQTKGELPPRFSSTLYRQLGAREVPKEPYTMGKPKSIQEGETGQARETPAALARSIVKNSAKVVDKTLVEGLRWYSEWMVDRLHRIAAAGGKPNTQQLAYEANRIIAQERELYGSLTDVLDPARREAGKLNRGTRWLHELKKINSTAAVSNMILGLEGKAIVPTFARNLVALADAANFRIGQLYQLVNPNFVPSHLVQRNPTGFGYDLIRQGAGEAWEKWVVGLADANNMPILQSVNFFRKWKKVLDDPRVNEAAIESVNQDFKRQFKNVVSHIHHAGQWQAVIHSDLFNYLESAARMASHKVSFRQFFPPTPAGRKAFQTLMDNVRAELGPEFQEDVTALMRSLQGHPTDSYNKLHFLRTGQPAGEAFRFLNSTIGNLFAKQVLTGQMFVQPGELFSGATPVFLGARNYLEGLARARQLYPEMERQGAVNRVIMDFSYDPHSPVRSASKIAGNTLSKLFMEQWLNEVQEASAAATAKVVSERISNGTLSPWERSMLPQTFRAMGFTRAEIPRIMAGDPALLATFESRAASFLTSGNKSIAEGSRIGANRLFNSVFRFQSYPMMKTNQLRKVFGNVGEAFSNGTRQEQIASIRMLSRYLFGSSVQGAITAALTTLFYQGFQGANVAYHEAKDEPFQFMVESALATMSGPLYMVWNGTRDKGLPGIGDSAARMLFPYQILKELYGFATGTGQYRDLNLYDRAAKYVQMKIPGSRAISQGLALVGLSQDNKELDAAIRGLYRWKRSELGISGTPPLYRNDKRKAFRTAMKRAVEALKDMDDEKYEAAMEDAYDALGEEVTLKEAKKSVQQSLRGKTLLRGVDGKELDEDQLDALRKRIGDRAVDTLEEFDAMLEAAARAE